MTEPITAAYIPLKSLPLSPTKTAAHLDISSKEVIKIYGDTAESRVYTYDRNGKLIETVLRSRELISV